MCLALPARVVSVDERLGLPVAIVDTDGTLREVSVAFVPDVTPGDYVIVHAGVAIQRLDEAAAAATLAMWQELGEPS